MIGQILGGDMASVGARAYNGIWGQSPQWGPEAEPLVRGSGSKAPQKLKASLLLDVSVQYFVVFIRFSSDNCMTLPEIEITW